MRENLDHIPFVDSTAKLALLEETYSIPSRSCNKNVGKIIYMGICFLVIFTAFTSATNLVSEIYDQLNYTSLGQLSSLIESLATLPVLMFPSFMDRWSYKNAIFVGSLGYVFIFFAGAMTTACADNKHYIWCQEESYVYGLNIICAIMSGLFSGTLWISSNRYIVACSNGANEGRFLGIFCAVFSVSELLGSLVAAYVLKHFGQFHFYLTTCAISLLAMLMVYLAPEVNKYDEKDSQQEGYKEQLLKVIKLSYSPRMRTLLLFLVFVGILLGIAAGFEYRIVLSTIPDMSQEDQNAITALVFGVQGLAVIIFCYIVGDLADKFKVSHVINGSLMTTFIAIGLSFLSYYMQSLVLAYVMAGVWGMVVATTSTLTGIVMMKDWNGSLESFALLQLLNNSATALGFGMCIWIPDVVTFLYVMLGLLIITQISTLLYKSPEN